MPPAATLEPESPAQAAAPANAARPGLLTRALRLARDPHVQKSLLAITDQAVVSGTNFVTNVIIGRACGKPELGLFGLAMSLVFFARGVQEQLVTAPYMVYCGRRDDQQLVRYAGSILVHQLLLGSLAAMALAAWAWSGSAPADFTPVLLVLMIALPILLLREFVRALSFAHLEAGTALAMDTFIAVAQLTALGVLAANHLLNVPVACWVLAAACGCATLGWFALRRQPMAASWSNVWEDWLHNWTFGRWALASQLLVAASPFVLPWVVFGTQGEAETGGYNAATTIVGAANMFVIGMSNFLAPQSARAFARGGLRELQTVLARGAAIYLVVIGGFCVGAFALGDHVATLVFGGEFAGIWMIIGLMSLAMLANSLGMVAGNGLWAMEKPSANFAADLIGMLATVAATATFVPLWGTLGAAAAMCSGNTISTLVRGWQLRKWMGLEAGKQQTAG